MTQPGQKSFLEIQQEVSDEILSMTIADTSSRPTLTALKRIINDAYRDVCSSWTWWWMYTETTLTIVANQTTPHYMDASLEDVMYINIASLQRKLGWMSETDWRVTYPGGFTNYGASPPWAYIPTIPNSDGSLGYYIFPKADQNYTAQVGGKLRVANLSADADVPKIPAQWQGLLLNLAKNYALKFQGISSSDSRREGYLNDFKDMWNRAWLEDQRMEESVWRFRNAEAERAQAAASDFTRGVWMQG